MTHIDQVRCVARFHPGQIVATPGALDALEETGQEPITFLSRHLSGDWGDLEGADKQANDHALRNRGRLLSTYDLRNGQQLFIITEWDRSVTTLLLPDEY
ncbi:MAG: hypothetical protein CYG59_22075 [Chloroflexi bacterium]|nr:MAG: hypothetical protein CYG59_22075 [Chloroflexota bacterium]